MNGFKIIKSADVFDGMIEYANKGALKGKYLGFPEFHDYYTMALGNCTDWTGFPQSGKTQVLMEFLLNTSEWYGWRHLIYFPDVGNEYEILADLIHKRTGKTFDKRYKNHITEMEISMHLDWILNHFIILTKGDKIEDLKAKMTPIEFWDYGVELSKDIEGGIQTMSVDSWKDLKHDKKEFGRDDLYLDHVLSYRNMIAERYNMHLHIVIHPNLTDKDKDGVRKPPGPYDLKGRTAWFDNGKCMITVHRPDGTKNKVDIMITKAKPRSVAKRGVYSMYFDLDRFRYYWVDNGEKKYCQQLNSEEIDELERSKINANKVKQKEQQEQVQQQSQVANIKPEEDDLPF